jgi:transcriptional regulator with GAF, ATPase, and Fis domain
MASALSAAALDLQQLAERASDPAALPEVLERALDALCEVVPYDLAAVFLLEGSTLRVVAAKGRLDGPAVRRHRLDLGHFPTIRRAIERRQPVALEVHHHSSDEGDPYDGVLDLPDGHACMVVPLYAGGRDLGIITLDRQVCEVYPAPTVALAGVYGQLVSLAMHVAEQAQLLARYRHRLKEHKNALVRETGGADVATGRLEATRSPAMRAVVTLARQAAGSDLPLLLQGETGTGKEVLAQAIHAWSPRADAPLVRINCAAIPHDLVESELFGHVRGSFSGAHADRRGHFQMADGGTLLLDEIGEMPTGTQAKLLRVLQEGTFHPVGAETAVTVDVRVLAATHRDLRAAVQAGTFREDLYYRLFVFPITLPPLRDRIEDVPWIARGVFDDLHARTGRGPWTLAPSALAALQNARWPGNVRELVNVLERATILQPHGTVEVAHLLLQPEPARDAPAPEPADLPSFDENERRYFRRLLHHTGGQIAGPGGAAERAGLAPSTLRSRLKKLGLLA